MNALSVSGGLHSPPRRSLRVATVGMACWLLAAFGAAAATPRTDWDRGANIKEAAEHLVSLQRQGGALGAFKFIVACYKTHMLAEHFSRPLEACIAQDYMLTQTMVAIYERLPPDARKQIHAVEPADLARALSSRISGALTQYKMSEQDGLEIKKLVDKVGLPLFLAKSFPSSTGGTGDTPADKPARDR